MRITIEGNQPGEIIQKLPEIVRQLMQLDGGHAPLEKAEAERVDPLEAEADAAEQAFAFPAELGMYRDAQQIGQARLALLRADVAMVLGELGREPG